MSANSTTPLDALAEEFGAVAGRIERECALRIGTAIAELRRVDAERELRFVNLERMVTDKLAIVRDGASITVDDVAPLIVAEVGRAVAAMPPVPKGDKGDAGSSVTVDDVRPMLAEMVAALPAPQDGKPGAKGDKGDSVSISDVRLMVAEEVAKIPPAADGTSVTVDDVAPIIVAEVSKAIAGLPPAAPGPKGDPGQNVTLEDVRPMLQEMVAALPPPQKGDPGPKGDPGASVRIEELVPIVVAEVSKAVAALPPAQDGKPGTSVTVDDVAPLIVSEVGKAVAAIPKPADGAPGAKGEPGSLPVAKAWNDGVHYVGSVVTYQGSTYQAQRDTGRSPPHDDWICLAAAGADGKSPEVIGTFDPAERGYKRLNIVALNGAAFIARRDDPGVCPGAGWQVISTQGKTGKPGERGGAGPRGPAGPMIERMQVNGEGLLTLVNADGSKVECDLYPVLAKISH